MVRTNGHEFNISAQLDNQGVNQYQNFYTFQYIFMAQIFYAPLLNHEFLTRFTDTILTLHIC